MPIMVSSDYDARREFALYYARRIATLDTKPAKLRHGEESWHRIACSKNIAFLLGLDRVSVPRLRPGSIKLKQGGA
jgi:hypothetical protein